MSTTQPLDFAIVGGGTGGLCLGLALVKRGISVHIYVAAHHFGEIGAGVSFTPNAVQTMKICHPKIHDTFEKICTRNMWPSKQYVWFNGYDGYTSAEVDKKEAHLFTLKTALGQNGVPRTAFLDGLIRLFPTEKASFGKKLKNYLQNTDGGFTLDFEDGTSATANAIIGYDEIKSHVRKSIFGFDHPCAEPSYSHKYAYRALVPMGDAVVALGEKRARNACIFADSTRLTAPARREDALRDFGAFGSDVKKLRSLAKPDLDVVSRFAVRQAKTNLYLTPWALFDLHDNPPRTFTKGQVCLLSDAAQATSPHHGAEAGMCIEDADWEGCSFRLAS